MNEISILEFWFEELTPKQWFMKDENLDSEIMSRFKDLHKQAIQGELFSWRSSARGSLAEVILLDQFSRNMYRNQRESFLYDPLALILSQQAISHGLDLKLEVQERAFLYMPFMHSESLIIHKEAIKLFSQKGLENNLNFEKRHLQIIERFERYPHRNQILGRKSSLEELEFLKEPGSHF
ncbi:DUF924 domain-containing protein [bacterium]|nr:DUF924 domain-containing protein [bacterium]